MVQHVGAGDPEVLQDPLDWTRQFMTGTDLRRRPGRRARALQSTESASARTAARAVVRMRLGARMSAAMWAMVAVAWALAVLATW